jgi:hypothetical protein
MAIIAIRPAIGVYFLLKKSGRHGFVKDMKAMGRRCMKEVARSTPVPRCWQ